MILVSMSSTSCYVCSHELIKKFKIGCLHQNVDINCRTMDQKIHHHGTPLHLISDPAATKMFAMDFCTTFLEDPKIIVASSTVVKVAFDGVYGTTA